MTFENPVWLIALAAVPVLLALTALAARRRRRYAVRYTVVDTLAGVAAALPRRSRHVPAALALLAACALVLAVARPQVSVAVPVERASVVLVTDVSGSMNAEDVEPTRLGATRRAARSFVDAVPDEQRVGLVSFSSAATVLQTPTTDHDAVKSSLEALSAEGATATGDALQNALDLLKEGRGADRPPAAIVLLSDGQRTAGRDPLPVAREARRLGIPVYTIALGTPGAVLQDPARPFGPGQPVPPDPQAMREIASVSGGRSFDVDDAGRLDQVYERLGSRLGTEQEDREVTAAFAGGALLLLFAALATGLRRRSPVP